VHVAPSVEDRTDLDPLADRADREVLGVGPRSLDRVEAEQLVERLVACLVDA
jgi:hypothetical protein